MLAIQLVRCVITKDNEIVKINLTKKNKIKIKILMNIMNEAAIIETLGDMQKNGFHLNCVQ